MAESSLHVIAKEGDVGTMKAALKSGNPNVGDADGMTPLHYAAWYGHPACVEALIAAGASVNAHDHDGSTALHAAAFNGQLACVLSLVEANADATITDNDDQTAAAVAATEGRVEIAAFLQDVEADQRAERTLQRMEQAYNEAKEKAKEAKTNVTKAVKVAKKQVAEMEKELKKLAKTTLKRKKEKTGAAPAAGPVAAPMSFSQLSLMETPAAPTGAKKDIKGRKTSTDESGSERSRKTSASEPTISGPDMDMLIAQMGADQSEDSTMIAFLELLDLKEFARVFARERINLDTLRKLTPQQLTDLGIPSGARKKLLSALRP